jgi:hypothetical protein
MHSNYLNKAAKGKSTAIANSSQKKASSSSSTAKLIDNRPEAIAQRKIHEAIQNNAPLLQSKYASHLAMHQAKSPMQFQLIKGDSSDQVIQRIGFGSLWSKEEGKYQANKVGSKRLAGDALWLAITLFTKKIPALFKSKHTVKEVIAEAEKTNKNVPFDKWKGTQADGTSREGQHLITSSFASKELKLPYELINGPENGMMLLSGRDGKGEGFTSEYIAAKSGRGKTPKEGIRHIGGGNGFAHPDYSKYSKDFVLSEYAKNNYTVGQAVPKAFILGIMAKLRAWHKQYDRSGIKGSVDTESHTLPGFTSLSSAPAPVVSGGGSALKDENSDKAGKVVGGVGMAAGAITGASYGSAIGGIPGALLGGAAGAAAGWWLGNKAGKAGADYIQS